MAISTFSAQTINAQPPYADVVILTALGLERRAVQAHLQEMREEIHPQEGTIYHCGVFTNEKQQLRVAVVETGGGEIRTAQETQRALAWLHPQVALFVGVAGRLKDVSLGDVVTATKVYAYERGKAGVTYQARLESLPASYALEQRARADASMPSWLRRRGECAGEQLPKVVIAPIASGEKVIASRQAPLYHFLHEHCSDAVAVETEGHGFLQAAHAHPGVQTLVVRGISDLVKGKKKADANQERAVRNAAAFTFEMLANFMPQLIQQRPSKSRPHDYIPFLRNPLFQSRPGEFDLEERLRQPKQAAHIELVGFIGMGGVGKTQLAVELAYRLQEQGAFPGGIFWTSLPSTDHADWCKALAELALRTDYLPPANTPARSTDDIQFHHAQYIARYIAQRSDRLLIVDNVAEPALLMKFLPLFAGQTLNCSLIYTSRDPHKPSPEICLYAVRKLAPTLAQRLLLNKTRPHVLAEIESGHQSPEAAAACAICQQVGYLPLALVHLRDALANDPSLTLTSLFEELQQRGALPLLDEVVSDLKTPNETITAVFQVSWARVLTNEARRLFLLASYFPEATHLPLWLLGLAAGLGEEYRLLSPLKKACQHLQRNSLLEELADEQIHLHPLVLDFGRHLLAQSEDQGTALRALACQSLMAACTVDQLEVRVRSKGYDGMFRDLHQIIAAVEAIGAETEYVALAQVERWLSQEYDLFTRSDFWPDRLPNLFFQQWYNHAIEEGYPPPPASSPPSPWLRLLQPSGAQEQSLTRIFTGNEGMVMGVAFSPDGKRILSGSEDSTMRLWEISTGRELRLFSGHQQGVWSVAFSPDDKQVLSGSADGTMRLWEISTGHELQQFSGHSRAIWSVAFSPDGQQILSGSSDGTMRLWEISTGRELRQFSGHEGDVWSVVFSSDGKQVLSGSADGTMRLWEISTGQELRLFSGHEGEVNSVAFSPDGKQVLAGSSDGTMRLWETSTGQELRLFSGHEGEVNSVAFSPDGKQVLAGLNDHTMRLWETNTGRRLQLFSGHDGWISKVAFSPDGQQVLSGSYDGTMRLWEIGTGQELRQFFGHEGEVNSVAFSPDGKQILSCSSDGTMLLQDTSTGQELQQFFGNISEVSSVAFSLNGKQILSGLSDGMMILWKTNTGQELQQFFGHSRVIWSVAFSPDGKQTLSGSEDGTMRLWEADSGRELRQFPGHNGVVDGVAFSPDGKQVLSRSGDGTICLWETSTGQKLQQFPGQRGGVRSAAFSPNGKQVLAGSLGITMSLWETNTGQKLLQLSDHSVWVNNVAFSPDGSLALASDIENKVLLWRIAPPEPGKLLGMFLPSYEVRVIHWRDQTHILLADYDHVSNRLHIYCVAIEGICEE